METKSAQRRFGDKMSLRRRGNRVWRVAGYRLYELDGLNKVASGEWFEAPDDEDAIEAAKAMMDGHDCELWRGSRLVARLSSKAKG